MTDNNIVKKDSVQLSNQEWNSYNEMERMLRNFFISPFVYGYPRLITKHITEFLPSVNLKETDKEYEISAMLPGLKKDDINIDVTTDHITISGERKCTEEKPGERYHLKQQCYGSFELSYNLPSDIKADDVAASYKDGVLDVHLPKAEIVEAKKIEVKDE